jgi:RNase adaptor protein for sRNA GlmZ degradation
MTSTITVRIISFGYGHGTPPVADVTYDLRALLHNPHHDPAMRELTGLDQTVYDHVMATAGASRLADHAARTAMALAEDTRTDITVAWGCTGGRHRSVGLARRTAEVLGAFGVAVTIEHRDAARDLLPPGSHARPRT